MSKSDLRDMLVSGASELGIGLSDAHVNACFVYLAELRKWNSRINLTAIRDDREIIIKHFLDSLAFLKGFSPAAGMRLLDMGSGAGFPALPIKIVRPGMLVVMVESVKKKASFLRHIIRTLDLDGAEVRDQRTGELPESLKAGFDVVSARAFSDMENALEVGAPFLRSGGVMVLGRGPEEGIDETAARRAGMVLERVEKFTLPLSDYRRAVWVFRKEWHGNAGMGRRVER